MDEQNKSPMEEPFSSPDLSAERELSKKERRGIRRLERKTEQARAGRSKDIKRIVVWLAILAGIGLIVYGIILGVTHQTATDGTPVAVDSLTEGDWVEGNPQASVVVVEYGDFQCPACGAYYPIVKGLSQEFADSVAFVYRHFPLYQIHQHAEKAARAAEAAGIQGKFWEMHDLLFARQTDWSKLSNSQDTFFKYAEELGLDMAQFETDFNSDAVKSAIDADYKGGISAGVNSTPSFFVNGEYITNPQSIDAFRAIITNAFKQ